MQWLPRHATYLRSRYVVDSSGHSPFENIHKRRFTAEILPFGEIILAKIGRQHELGKFESDWVRGVWVGRQVENMEHIVLIPNGVLLTRTVRRLPVRDQNDGAFALTVNGYPWQYKAAEFWQGDGFHRFPKRASPSTIPISTSTLPVSTSNDQQQQTATGLKDDQHEMTRLSQKRPLQDSDDPMQLDTSNKTPQTNTQQQTSDDPQTHDAEDSQNVSKAKIAGFHTKQSMQYHDFVREKGATSQCHGCKCRWICSQNEPHSTSQYHHTKLCKQRQAEWVCEKALHTAKEHPFDVSIPGGKDSECVQEMDTSSGKRKSMSTNEGSADNSMEQSDKPESLRQRLCSLGIYDTEQIPGLPNEFEVPNLENMDRKALERVARAHNISEENLMAAIESEITRLVSDKVFEETTAEAHPEAREISSTLAVRVVGDKIRVRIVVQDFNDGKKTPAEFFSPTPSNVGIRLLFLIALKEHKQIRFADFSHAFFQTPYEGEPLVIKPPKMFLGKRRVRWFVLKAWPGLRKSPHLFGEMVSGAAMSIGFRRLKIEPQLYYHPAEDMIFGCHVDDTVSVGSDSVLDRKLGELGKLIRFKHVREVTADIQPFLGKNYRRPCQSKLELQQDPEYHLQMLKMLGLEHCRILSTPAIANIKPSTEFEQANWDTPISEEAHGTYRHVVGKLRFVNNDRTDLMYSNKELSKDLACPTTESWCKMIRTMKYLRGTSDTWLVLSAEADDGEPWKTKISSDTDWAGDVNSRRSATSIIAMVDHCLIYESSTMQTVIAMSSAEAEFYGLASAATIGLYIQNILAELNRRSTIHLYCDSSSAISLAERQGVGRIRHLAIKVLWLQDLIASHKVTVSKVKGEFNCADVGTKALAAGRLRLLSTMCGLRFDNPEGHRVINALRHSSARSILLRLDYNDSYDVLFRTWQGRGGTTYYLSPEDCSSVLHLSNAHLNQRDYVHVWMSLPFTFEAEKTKDLQQRKSGAIQRLASLVDRFRQSAVQFYFIWPRDVCDWTYFDAVFLPRSNLIQCEFDSVCSK